MASIFKEPVEINLNIFECSTHMKRWSSRLTARLKMASILNTGLKIGILRLQILDIHGGSLDKDYSKQSDGKDMHYK